MSRFKSLKLGGMAMLLSVSSFAADYQWLTFRLSDNKELAVAADDLSIRYEDGNLYLKSSIVDQFIPVGQIQTMRFTKSSVSVSELKGEGENMAEYFTITGRMVGCFASKEDARRNLPPGMYVGKNEGKPFKIIF